MPDIDDVHAVCSESTSKEGTSEILLALRQAFHIADGDDYIYRAEAFAMTIGEVQTMLAAQPQLKYTYQAHGQAIEIPTADIDAYTSIFAASTSTTRSLKAFEANARKDSPRALAASYLVSKRLPLPPEVQVPRQKQHANPALQVWQRVSHATGFCGPLPDKHYADPQAAKLTHPILPLLYHHFGCVPPTLEALGVVKHYALQGAKARGDTYGRVVEIGSGNGYWTCMLRRLDAKLHVVAVDDASSAYRTVWIDDTVCMDGIQWLKKNSGAMTAVLLMVYPVTGRRYTENVLKAFQGDTIVLVGTQNANRYTAFANTSVEEWFKEEMDGWILLCRIAMPSFAG